MLDRDLINDEFSDIKDVIFLNISSSSIPPKCVQKAYLDFTEKRIKTFGKTVIKDGREVLDCAKNNVAKLINADPSEIAFIKNTSEGIGMIANGYPFKINDNIIVCDQDFSSTVYPWINLQKKGVNIRVVESKDGSILIEDIIRRIDHNTKVVVISAVQFTTGFYINLYKLGKVCKDNNILFIVDGIQAVGRLNIDVKKMNISFLACGGYKGLLSTFGEGFIFCDSSIVKDIVPLSANHLNVKSVFEPPKIQHDFSKIEWYEDSRRFEAGHLNYAGISGINEACKLINKLGIKEIEEYILELQNELINRIRKLPFDFITPIKPENYSGIFSIYYPKHIEDKFNEIMEKYNIIATIKNGYIRIGLSFYNTKEQMIRIAEAFEEVAKLRE